MLALVLVLILLWIVLGLVGVLVKLVWLAVIAGVLILATLVLGGAALRRRRPVR